MLLMHHPFMRTTSMADRKGGILQDMLLTIDRVAMLTRLAWPRVFREHVSQERQANDIVRSKVWLVVSSPSRSRDDVMGPMIVLSLRMGT